MIHDLIYDVGMNNGDDTAYYLYRGFRVVSIEANPELIGPARRRFERQIAQGRLTVLNVAIARETGELPFWICDGHSPWSSFNRDIASRDGLPHHAITVTCRTFGSILRECGIPWYLKVDIEGSDHLCIRDLDPLDLPSYISVEAGSIGLLKLLRDKGFTAFKCISQHNFKTLELPATGTDCGRILRLLWSRHPVMQILRRLGSDRLIEHQINRGRRFNGWSFPFDSSGPFGPDLPGTWQDCDQMTDTYSRFIERHQRGRPSPFWNRTERQIWCDFHARSDE